MAAPESFGTFQVHADDGIEQLSDVSPAMHLSSTFQYDEDNRPRDAVYSRISIPTVQRCEAVLGRLLNAHAVTYSSGLSAVHALLVHLSPKRIFLERAEKGGYHGTLGVAKLVSRLSGMVIHSLDELNGEVHELGSGDVVWLESPLNPTGEVTDIARYAALAKSTSAVLVVDATFAPPPLQDPFQLGAHWVMHSATKYFGGHSDLLAGVLASLNKEAIDKLLHDRTFLGTIPSGQTAWLLLRSLRTFDMRIARQASSATQIVSQLVSLVGPKGLYKVAHSSLQQESFVQSQMIGGHSPTFAIYFQDETQAARFPNLLQLFHHATSLGGVESLVEWRALSDAHCDRRIVRLSIGVENPSDLWHDLAQAIHSVTASDR